MLGACSARQTVPRASVASEASRVRLRGRDARRAALRKLAQRRSSVAKVRRIIRAPRVDSQGPLAESAVAAACLERPQAMRAAKQMRLRAYGAASRRDRWGLARCAARLIASQNETALASNRP